MHVLHNLSNYSMHSYLTLFHLVTQKFGCPARLRVLHREDEQISEIWNAQVHRHNVEADLSLVFKVRVSDVMHDLCSTGLTAAKIRVVLCDKLFEGNDQHPELPSRIQVVNKSFLISSARSCLVIIQ